MNKIDFTELEEEVMQVWEDNCVVFIDYGAVENSILPEYQEVLDDPMQCVLELGFKSISSYIASKTNPPTNLSEITTYSQYLKYLKDNNITAQQWVKDWAKEILV